MKLKPIETRYDGYRFRSRLEARWAVFFDSLGIKYEYEKEGYDLGEAGWYLPDFWLPDASTPYSYHDEQGIWAEVKGTVYTEMELKKCRALTEFTDNPTVMLMGAPAPVYYYDLVGGGSMVQCKPYGLFVRIPALNWGILAGEMGVCDLSSGYVVISQAVTAARSARFEFGDGGLKS